VHRSALRLTTAHPQGVSALAATCRQRRFTLIEHVEGSIGVGALPTLQASRPGLFRVFQNLIANAFKFHNGDAPQVTVSARHGDVGWVFSVRDNGIGLPKDSAIFEMFKRGGGEHEGSGIGLATCRRIVEAHGGRIWAEPAPEAAATSSSRSRPDLGRR
jgi:signal transduction histidine kinase